MVSLQVRNDLNVSVSLSSEIKSISQSPSTNSVVIFSDTPSFHSAISWIKSPKDGIILEPGKTIPYPLSVRVPTAAEPGGWSAAALVSPKPLIATSEGAIQVQEKIATVLLFSVPGEVVVQERIKSFTTDKSWYMNLPVKFSLDYLNNGTVHTTPMTMITIRNWRGKIVSEIPVNQELRTVLPKNERVFIASWRMPFANDAFGLIKTLLVIPPAWGKMTASVTVGPSVDSQTATLTFWLIPIVPIVIALFIIFILLLWYRRALMRLRQSAPAEKDSER
ncbi:MAG: hypothetical protein HW383_358 [Candidatus Magasanikbacteria bacterium]|nr:hypothetical protein [Candidatus Magasanikbacteria bacterium]